VQAAASRIAGVGSGAEEPVVAGRAVGVHRGAAVRHLVARLDAIGITVRARAGVARVERAASAEAEVRCVAEEPVVAGRAVEVHRAAAVRALVAGFDAVGVTVRARARVACVQAAAACTAGVGSRAVEPVVAGCAVVRMRARARAVADVIRTDVRVGHTERPDQVVAVVGRLVAGIRALRPAGAGVAHVQAAAAGVTGVCAGAEEPVIASRAVRVCAGAAVRALVALLGAVGVAVRARAGIARVAAASCAAGIRSGTEEAVVAR